MDESSPSVVRGPSAPGSPVDVAATPSKRRWSLLRNGLVAVGGAFAVYLLLSAAGGLESMLHAVRHANPGWLLAAVVATAGGLVASALQLMGATSVPLSVVRTTRVQLAAAFADAATPASLGRLGVDAGYLRECGLDAGEASASVTLDALAGVVAHLALLAVTLVVAGAAPQTAFPHISRWVWLVVIALVVVAAAAAFLGPQRWRQRLHDTIASATRAAEATLRRPEKVAQLLGGAAALTALQIAALYACVLAFGVHVGLVATALVYLVGGGVASLVPTPGSLGAVEAALIGGLVAAGADSGGAVAVALTFRLVTLWAPLVPGAVAFFHLRRQTVL